MTEDIGDIANKKKERIVAIAKKKGYTFIDDYFTHLQEKYTDFFYHPEGLGVSQLEFVPCPHIFAEMEEKVTNAVNALKLDSSIRTLQSEVRAHHINCVGIYSEEITKDKIKRYEGYALEETRKFVKRALGRDDEEAVRIAYTLCTLFTLMDVMVSGWNAIMDAAEAEEEEEGEFIKSELDVDKLPKGKAYLSIAAKKKELEKYAESKGYEFMKKFDDFYDEKFEEIAGVTHRNLQSRDGVSIVEVMYVENILGEKIKKIDVKTIGIKKLQDLIDECHKIFAENILGEQTKENSSWYYKKGALAATKEFVKKEFGSEDRDAVRTAYVRFGLNSLRGVSIGMGVLAKIFEDIPAMVPWKGDTWLQKRTLKRLERSEWGIHWDANDT